MTAKNIAGIAGKNGALFFELKPRRSNYDAFCRVYKIYNNKNVLQMVMVQQ